MATARDDNLVPKVVLKVSTAPKSSMGTFHHHSHWLSIKSFSLLQIPLPQHFFYKFEKIHHCTCHKV
jgi:hypothetical protein